MDALLCIHRTDSLPAKRRLESACRVRVVEAVNEGGAAAAAAAGALAVALVVELVEEEGTAFLAPAPRAAEARGVRHERCGGVTGSHGNRPARLTERLTSSRLIPKSALLAPIRRTP